MNAQVPDIAQKVHVTKLAVKAKPEDAGKLVDWLAHMMMEGVGSSSVLSAEIIPPGPNETEWLLVQRFYSQELLDAWLKSDGRKKLLDQLKPHIDNNEVSMLESVDESFGTVGSVAVAVVTHVKPGQESAYCQTEGRYQSAQARYPGYKGAYVQPPTKGTAGIWTTLIRFDSPSAMDHWFASDERKKLLGESENLVSSTAFQAVNTSFPGFFPSDKVGAKGPPNYKTAMLILLGLYPIVMLSIRFLMPTLGFLPSAALKNFVGNIISVYLTTWITMPAFIKAFSPWLFPNENTPKWTGTVSILILLSLYALEITLLWGLL